MAVDSKYHRYRDAGERANINNVEEYGVPARSLFTSTKVLTLHHHIDITDEHGNLAYESNTKFLSIHRKTDITDAKGRQVAHIEAKVLTLHARHYVTWQTGPASNYPMNSSTSSRTSSTSKDLAGSLRAT